MLLIFLETITNMRLTLGYARKGLDRIEKQVERMEMDLRRISPGIN